MRRKITAFLATVLLISCLAMPAVAHGATYWTRCRTGALQYCQTWIRCYDNVSYYCGYSWIFIDRTVPSYPRYGFVKHVGVSGSHYHYDYSTSVESINGLTYYCYDFPG